jgi:hypothetical protein
MAQLSSQVKRHHAVFSARIGVGPAISQEESHHRKMPTNDCYMKSGLSIHVGCLSVNAVIMKEEVNYPVMASRCCQMQGLRAIPRTCVNIDTGMAEQVVYHLPSAMERCYMERGEPGLALPAVWIHSSHLDPMSNRDQVTVSAGVSYRSNSSSGGPGRTFSSSRSINNIWTVVHLAGRFRTDAMDER